MLPRELRNFHSSMGKFIVFQILNLKGFLATSLCVCVCVCLTEVEVYRPPRTELVFCFHLSLSDGTQVAMACLPASTSTQKSTHRAYHNTTTEGHSHSVGHLNLANLENKVFKLRIQLKCWFLRIIKTYYYSEIQI